MCQGLNEDDVRALMRQEIKRRGSQAAWARSIGETPQGVSVMLLHRRPVGRVLEALGLEERATFYVKGSTNNDSIA